MSAGQPDRATVMAAQAGDQQALDALVAGYLPLLYNVVGRALGGHADVDDVVQETLLRALRGLGSLRAPDSFRSWLVAIAMRLVRDRHHAGQRLRSGEMTPDDVADPGADFVDLTIVRLGLSGQRREVVEATRWLDRDDRDLLSLWWLEAAGELTRDEVGTAMGLSREHAAVRIQRMKGQLETARVVVRALHAQPRCVELAVLAAAWDGIPGPLWRKRFARHTRDCAHCAGAWSDLVAAERLLAGLALVPVPALLVSRAAGATAAARPHHQPESTGGGGAGRPVSGHRARPRAWRTAHPTVKPVLAALLVGVVLATATTVAYALRPRSAPPVAVGGSSAPSATPTPGALAVGPAPASSAPSSRKPSARHSRSVRSAPAAPPVAPARRSAKKGVGAYHFDGVNAAMKDVKVSWYYNWTPKNAHLGAPGVEFVPMIWGAKNVTKEDLDRAKQEGRVLLGFNEPDRPDQANMSVKQALDLWPQLMATGMRLGSPAVSWGADTQGMWLDEFMKGAKARGHRVDFIAVHAYQGDFSDAAVGKFKRYLERTYARYRLPIWVTEFAMVNFSRSPNVPSQSRQAAFATASTTMLEGLPFVERYAWFALPARDADGTGLYRPGARPTLVGQAYRAAGPAR